MLRIFTRGVCETLFANSLIEGDLSPSLADVALLSVVGVVDGQVTVLSCLVLSQKEEIHLQSLLPLQSSLVPTSDRHRPGFLPSERTGPGFFAFKASADRPAQKNAASDIISTKLVT